VPDHCMFHSCLSEMDEPPIHAFSPHISRGSADQQNSQPVNTQKIATNLLRRYARASAAPPGMGVFRVSHVRVWRGICSSLRGQPQVTCRQERAHRCEGWREVTRRAATASAALPTKDGGSACHLVPLEALIGFRGLTHPPKGLKHLIGNSFFQGYRISRASGRPGKTIYHVKLNQ
jgi:hypothetical protein